MSLKRKEMLALHAQLMEFKDKINPDEWAQIEEQLAGMKGRTKGTKIGLYKELLTGVGKLAARTPEERATALAKYKASGGP
jgi:hypothetical protein